MKAKEVQVQENFNLVNYNTMGVEAHARYFAEVHSVEELQLLLNDSLVSSELPLLVIGEGSNILFLNDFGGLVIHNQVFGKEVIDEDEEHIYLKAGAGENWHDLVMYCVGKGWGGIENLALIPGLVGAAPIQNIGAYGVELADVFFGLQAVEVKSGRLLSFSKEECNFGYRDSIFKNKLKGKVIITSVTLKLSKHPEIEASYSSLSEKLEEKNIKSPTIKDISDAVIEIRKSKLPDPAHIGNAGSFFKNPVIPVEKYKELKSRYNAIPGYPDEKGVKIPAAWLIDTCGWKGKRIGDAGVHDMQALVIVNHGKASGRELFDLARRIQQSVKKEFGVELIPEVNLI